MQWIIEAVFEILLTQEICTFIPEGGVVSRSPRTGLQSVVFCTGYQREDVRLWFSGQIDKNMIQEGGIIL